MTHFGVPLLLSALLPLIAVAQTPTLELNRLRSAAQVEGSVEVKVTTHAVAETALKATAPTTEQQAAIERAQRRILIQLVSSGLVVGNEISVESDGSFTIRVLAAGLNRLVESVDVAELRSNDSGVGGVVR